MGESRLGREASQSGNLSSLSVAFVLASEFRVSQPKTLTRKG
jgi:hypothetical protein